MSSYSLRRRLLTLLLASVVVAWAVTMLLTYQHAHHELDELLATRPRLVAVLEEVRDPGNAGTIIRVADAAGPACLGRRGQSFRHIAACLA